MTSAKKRPFVILLLCGAVLGYFAWRSFVVIRPQLHVFEGPSMGTSYQIKVIAALDSTSYRDLHQIIESKLESVNQQMSTYIPSSEISLFNQSSVVDDWQKVSEDFAYVVHLAAIIHEASGGFFDPTLMPLVNLWGFGPQKGSKTIPDPSLISQLLGQLGMKEIEVRKHPPSLRKLKPEICLDLSGIAKGFGVDVLGEFLEGIGIVHYMVEIGGEVRARGLNARQQPWQVAIESPAHQKRGTGQRVLGLSNAAMATSGDYRNQSVIDGQMFSHTIDPRTGYPVKHKLTSVTVIAESCAVADGWATAILVAGPQDGIELADKFDLAAYLLVSNGSGGFEELMSQRFRQDFANKEMASEEGG